jgi:rhodanese-related sulfurtransferase
MSPIKTIDPAHLTPAFTRTRRSLSLLVLSLGLTMAACSPQAAASDSVTLDVARAEFEAGRAILIDIREPSEHATGVAQGAQLLPMRQLNTRLTEIPTATDKPVLLICNTQNRSSSTLSALRERGYAHVRYVQGGMSEWNRRGWPVVKP